MYVDIILAADDYINFITLMKQYKTKLREGASAADAGEEEAKTDQAAAAGTGDSAQ